MNETVIIILAICLPLFLVSRIRFILRFIRLRRSSEHSLDVLFGFSGDGLEACFYCCAGLGALGADNKSSDTVNVDEEERKKALRALRDSEATKKTSDATLQSKMSDEDAKKVIINKIPNVEKISLEYLSRMTLIPCERIVDILSNDYDYLVDGAYVINNSMVPEMDFEETISDSIGIQNSRNWEGGTTTEGICLECQSFYEKGSLYCPNCGIKLKNK